MHDFEDVIETIMPNKLDYLEGLKRNSSATPSTTKRWSRSTSLE